MAELLYSPEVSVGDRNIRDIILMLTLLFSKIFLLLLCWIYIPLNFVHS